MKQALLLCSLTALSFGCGSSQVNPPPANGAGPDAGLSSASPTACSSPKIGFKQTEGCLNDGAVEFCVVGNTASIEARLRAIAPNLARGDGSGRAGCDPAVETRFVLPTPGDAPIVCIAYHGAMTADTWSQVCQLAAVPEVRAIVPTFYE